MDLTQTTPPSTPTSRRSPSPSPTSALNTQKTKTKEDTMKDNTAKKKKGSEMKINSETENTEITVDPRTLCKQEMVVGNREDLKTLQE